jgi:hypothetical protein
MTQAEAKSSGNPKLGAVKLPSALNPEQLAITQPWKDYVSRGLITRITAVFTPTGTSIKMEVSSAIKLPDGVDCKEAPPGIVRQAIDDAGFSKKKKDKSAESAPLPKRSLCARDLEDEGKLQDRIDSVAKAIGPNAAAGRIGSLQLYIAGCDNFDSWWSAAKASDKVRLLMDEKNFQSLTVEQKQVIASKLGGQSPFRGSVPTPTEKETEPKTSQSQGAPQKGESGESSKKGRNKKSA